MNLETAEPQEQTVTPVRADRIRVDGGTQVRATLDVDHVNDLREHLDQLPPLIVFYDGTDYWLADGFHRFEAMRDSRIVMRCIVHSGTRVDAQFFACGANKRHGLKLGTGDKQNAVRLALKIKGREYSQGKIAEHCGCTQAYVSKLIKLHGSDGGLDPSPSRATADSDNPSPTQTNNTVISPSTSSKGADGKDGRTINTSAISEAQRKRHADRAAAKAEADRVAQYRDAFNGIDPIKDIDASWRSTAITSMGLSPFVADAVKKAKLKTAGHVFDVFVNPWEHRNNTAGGLQQLGIGSADVIKIKTALVALFERYAGNEVNVEATADAEPDAATESEAPAERSFEDWVKIHNDALNAAIADMERHQRLIAAAIVHRKDGDIHHTDNPATKAHSSWSGTVAPMREPISAMKANLIVPHPAKPGEWASASYAQQFMGKRP